MVRPSVFVTVIVTWTPGGAINSGPGSVATTELSLQGTPAGLEAKPQIVIPGWPGRSIVPAFAHRSNVVAGAWAPATVAARIEAPAMAAATTARRRIFFVSGRARM